MSEKYINFYIETMTATLTDVVVRNISLQANEKVSTEIIQEQAKQLEEYKSVIDELENKINNGNDDHNKLILDLQNKINNLNVEMSSFNSIKNEYESVKHQVQHVDTFRKELAKEREEHQKTRNVYENRIKDLQNQIDYLQLTPAQKKKISVGKVLPIEEPIKDGGKF